MHIPNLEGSKMKNKALLLIGLVVVLTACLVIGCDRDPISAIDADQQSVNQSIGGIKNGDLDLQDFYSIAEQLAKNTISEGDYQNLLLLGEEPRQQLRPYLLNWLTEEEITASDQIYAIAGPPPGWFISAEVVNNFQIVNKGDYSIDADPFVDVPFFSQKDGKWFDKPLGYNYDGTATIAKFGCHLCCVAMLYVKWGYKNMTPLVLNSWCKGKYDHYAFSKGVENGDLINPTQALEYGGVSRPWGSIASNKVEAKLKAKQPVIAKLKMANGGNHFVVIFTKKGNSFWVKDPLKDAANQDQPLSNNVVDFRVYGAN